VLCLFSFSLIAFEIGNSWIDNIDFIINQDRQIRQHLTSFSCLPQRRNCNSYRDALAMNKKAFTMKGYVIEIEVVLFFLR
jgi:hypothetical protein